MRTISQAEIELECLQIAYGRKPGEPMNEEQPTSCSSCGGKWVDHLDSEILCSRVKDYEKKLFDAYAALESLQETLKRRQTEIRELQDDVKHYRGLSQ